MATLSSALNYALSGLSAAAAQSALASRNVAFAQDPNYSRRTAQIISLTDGSATIAAYNRSADRRLLEKLLESTSLSEGQSAMLKSLTSLSQQIGDPEADRSVAALVSKLQSSLRDLEANPSSGVLAANVVLAANSVVRALGQGTDAVQATRVDADQEMAASVDSINTLLAQFKIANDAIVRGSGTPADLTDSLDERDRILKLLSEEIGIRAVTRSNNDIAIYTEGGVTLFETVPRKIEFSPTTLFTPDTRGDVVRIDGVSVLGAQATMPSTSGRLASLARVRDEITVTFQTQLDEIARGLIEVFAESDQQVPASLPDVAGLFLNGTYTGVPPSGIAIPGLAARIRLNPLADPTAGGNPLLIRDGGFGGPDYVYNSSGADSFQARINELQAGFDSSIDFSSDAKLEATGSLKSFSLSAAGWIEALRQNTDDSAQSSAALRTRSAEALLRVTGVNIDEEMAAILDLERSYQASAKVISTLDSMLGTLFDSIR
ncbi:MAG: flagellar hook-associated protein FlgK [Alphaproteobacteria bacterium]|nr:flagellar hook-associated protein FlgK [Alphaproteobacteria bacterium]